MDGKSGRLDFLTGRGSTMRVRPQIRHRTTGEAGVRSGNEYRSTLSGRADLRGSCHPVAGGVVGQEGGRRNGTGEPVRGFPRGPEAGKGPGWLRPSQARPPEARSRGGPGRLRPGQALRAWRAAGGGGGNRSAVPSRIGARRRLAVLWRDVCCVGRCNVLQYKKGDLRVATGWRKLARLVPPQRSSLCCAAGRDPPQRSDGSRVSRVGRRAGLRAVPQSGSARSLLQVSRWSSMELALAGRGQVSVGDCSVIGWGKMFGTGGARRMLSRMFGGVDAGLSLGDLSGGARAFQPGHAAKFAQGPRRSGSSFCCPQAGSPPQRIALLRVCFVGASMPSVCGFHVTAERATRGRDPPTTTPRRAGPETTLPNGRRGNHRRTDRARDPEPERHPPRQPRPTTQPNQHPPPNPTAPTAPARPARTRNRTTTAPRRRDPTTDPNRPPDDRSDP